MSQLNLQKRRILSFFNRFLCVLCILALSFPVLSVDVSAKPNPKYGSIVIDADTGQVLSGDNQDKILHPASLTKVMTLLLLFDAVESKKMSKYTRIRMTKHAASMVPSKLDLPVGSRIRAKDAVLSLVTKSANDVAVAVAEHIGGSEKNFARMMNKKAREIGMKRTHFRNASGLHHPKQVTTPRDMAKMARYVIKKYPSYYRYFKTKSFTYKGKTYKNHNRLMSTYPGMDGMKTGYISASGFNLIASAVQNDRRLIGVVFGGKSGKSRNAHMAVLLDKAFKKKPSLLLARAKSASKPVKKPQSLIQVSAITQPPLPPRKPPVAHAVSALSRIAPASGLITKSQAPADGSDSSYKWVSVEPLERFQALIGEGDSDLDMSKRIETGLIAIGAHKGEPVAPRYQLANTPMTNTSEARVTNVSYQPPPSPHSKDWAIQVGAFASRAASDTILIESMKALPAEYAHARPVIAPLKTTDGWMFRARLSGYSRAEASKACGYISDCLLVVPQH